MRKFKKLLSLSLVGIMLLSGCQGGDKPKKTDESKSEAPSESVQGSQESNTDKEPTGPSADAPMMTWIVGNTSAEVDDDAEVVKMIESRFNIDLKTWRVDDTNTLSVRLAGGEMPDVMVVGNSSEIPNLVKGGVLHEMPIEDLKEKAPNYYKATEEYGESLFWSSMLYEGKNYGAPQPMQNVPMAMFYRKDWLDKLNLELPTTIEELENVLEAFVTQDPDGDGQNNTYGMAERTFNAIFGAYGLRCVTGGSKAFKVEEMQLGDDNIPFFPWIRPEAKEVLTLLANWYNRGLIDPEFVTGENTGGYTWLSHSFMNNKIGLTCAQPYHYLVAGTDTTDSDNYGICMTELKGVNPDADIAIGLPPKGPKGQSGTEAWNKSGRLTALTTQAFKDERVVNAFYAMLDAYYSDMDYARLANYGIEDVHWKKSPYGPVRIMEGTQLREQGVLQVDFGSTVPFSMNITPEKVKFGEEVTGNGYWRYNAPAVPEFAENIDTLKSLTNQAFFDIISNQKPIDYFDEFVEEFKNAGGESIEKAVQEEQARILAELNQ